MLGPGEVVEAVGDHEPPTHVGADPQPVAGRPESPLGVVELMCPKARLVRLVKGQQLSSWARCHAGGRRRGNARARSPAASFLR